MKYIIGYEGLYKIDNLGNVFSLTKNKYRKLQTDKMGYLNVFLYKNNIPKIYKVHRLVAMAFIQNPENKPFVNHINGIKNDNRVENLEWVTKSENCLHAYSIGLNFRPKGGLSPRAKKIINTETKKIYDCVNDAVKDSGFSRTFFSSMMSGKKRNTTKFKYYEEPFDL